MRAMPGLVGNRSPQAGERTSEGHLISIAGPLPDVGGLMWGASGGQSFHPER